MTSTNHLSAPGTCDVQFWDFALPVALGSMAGLGAAVGARALMRDEKPGTQAAAASVANAVAFWLVGGLTFVMRQRRRH